MSATLDTYAKYVYTGDYHEHLTNRRNGTTIIA